MSYPFPFTPKKNIKIWRYLDFSKFVSLLDTGCLFFSRSDLLGDTFEGSYSHADKKLREIMEKNWGIDYSNLINIRKRSRKLTFINCWHASGIESDAMWRVYTKSYSSIAILSTYDRLYKCLPPDVTISLVKYINYKSGQLPEVDLISPYFYKHQSFHHERELRAIIQDIPPIDDLSCVEPESVAGKYIPVNLNYLILRIYVAPSSPSWFLELVTNICRKYEITKRIVQSNLNNDPFF